jgi:hypothetical protein
MSDNVGSLKLRLSPENEIVIAVGGEVVTLNLLRLHPNDRGVDVLIRGDKDASRFTRRGSTLPSRQPEPSQRRRVG